MNISPTRRHTVALSLLAVSALAGVVLASGSGAADAHDYDRSIEIGVFGDMPYGDYGRAHFPAVLSDINRNNVDFSVFVGDTKNGSEPCFADAHESDPANPTPENAIADATHPDVYKAALKAFNSLARPVVYLPGDNEWTDCDRTSIKDGQSADSNDRLAYLRSLSYPTSKSLGRHTMPLVRQSKAYPENVRWEDGPVTFIGLNVPGSDNNFSLGGKEGPAAEGQAEYTSRNAANLEWIRKGFAEA